MNAQIALTVADTEEIHWSWWMCLREGSQQLSAVSRGAGAVMLVQCLNANQQGEQPGGCGKRCFSLEQCVKLLKLIKF